MGCYSACSITNYQSISFMFLLRLYVLCYLYMLHSIYALPEYLCIHLYMLSQYLCIRMSYLSSSHACHLCEHWIYVHVSGKQPCLVRCNDVAMIDSALTNTISRIRKIWQGLFMVWISFLNDFKMASGYSHLNLYFFFRNVSSDFTSNTYLHNEHVHYFLIKYVNLDICFRCLLKSIYLNLICHTHVLVMYSDLLEVPVYCIVISQHLLTTLSWGITLHNQFSFHICYLQMISYSCHADIIIFQVIQCFMSDQESKQISLHKPRGGLCLILLLIIT